MQATARRCTLMRFQVAGGGSCGRLGSPTSGSTTSGTPTRRSCCCRGYIRRSCPNASDASVGITLDTYSHVLPAMQEEVVRAFDALFPTT
jgi:hypothetical protein